MTDLIVKDLMVPLEEYDWGGKKQLKKPIPFYVPKRYAEEEDYLYESRN